MNNVRPLLCLLIIAGIGPTAHTDAQRQPPGAPPSGGPPIAVAEQRPITLADHEQILGLSPEGGRLLVLRGDEICIYDIENVAEARCTTWSGDRLDVDSFAWAPDGRHLAFTELAAPLLVDSDLWLLAIETAELRNLTDDGVGGGLPVADDDDRPFQVDLVPAWSPDGTELAFIRLGRGAPMLYRIPLGGGQPRPIASLRGVGVLGTVPTGMAWLRPPAGDLLAYSAIDETADDLPANTGGVWTVALDRPTPHRVSIDFGRAGASPNRFFLAGGSARGDLLVVDLEAAALFEPPIVAVVTPAGRLQLIGAEDDPTTTRAANLVYAATFSPDGQHLLYATVDERLLLRNLGTGTDVTLSSNFTAGGPFVGQGLDWAADGTVFAATSPSSGLVLRIEGLPIPNGTAAPQSLPPGSLQPSAPRSAASP